MKHIAIKDSKVKPNICNIFSRMHDFSQNMFSSILQFNPTPYIMAWRGESF